MHAPAPLFAGLLCYHALQASRVRVIDLWSTAESQKNKMFAAMRHVEELTQQVRDYLAQLVPRFILAL